MTLHTRMAATGPVRAGLGIALTLWNIPVGNPVALCNTQHTGKEIFHKAYVLVFCE